jgi:uncharacterized integral membrane protein
MEGTRKEGRGARFWFTIVLIAIGFVFVAVNFQKVTIDFVVGETKAPLVVALLISGVIGFLIGLVLPRFREHGSQD